MMLVYKRFEKMQNVWNLRKDLYRKIVTKKSDKENRFRALKSSLFDNNFKEEFPCRPVKLYKLI